MRRSSNLTSPCLRPEKRRKLAKQLHKYIHSVDAGQEGSEESEQDCDVKAQSRLSQFVEAGVISLGGSDAADSHDDFATRPSRKALTIEMANGHFNTSDGDSGLKCAMCPARLDSLSELSRHELSEHFAWVFKPLLMHLLDIIGDDSYHCPCPRSSCSLRLQLVKCIDSHQTCCPECHFASNCSYTLMEHYKVISKK